ncbi:MAG TPA: ribonuclease P protein component [Dehalococcoidia bacterium]
MRRRVDFDRVFQQGRHNSGRLLALRSTPNELAFSRFAYAVPKRVGTAVVRNKVRRRLREILRALPFEEGFDVVISVRPEAARSSFYALKQEVETLLRRARLLAGQASPRAASSP